MLLFQKLFSLFFCHIYLLWARNWSLAPVFLWESVRCIVLLSLSAKWCKTINYGKLPRGGAPESVSATRPRCVLTDSPDSRGGFRSRNRRRGWFFCIVLFSNELIVWKCPDQRGQLSSHTLTATRARISMWVSSIVSREQHLHNCRNQHPLCSKIALHFLCRAFSLPLNMKLPCFFEKRPYIGGGGVEG